MDVGAVSRFGGKNLLLALFDIAYHSRLGLPLLVSAGFMLFDLHLRLEVEFEAHVQQGEEEQQPEGEAAAAAANNPRRRQ
jgi:hypothetical protein